MSNSDYTDHVTNNIKVITQEHHEMHEGDHYFVKTFIADTGGEGSISYFAFTTPDTLKRIHAKVLIAPDSDYTVEIYEEAEISDGIPIVGINNDRDSLNVAELVPVSAPTIIDIGDLIWAARNGGGKNPVGVAPGFNYEIIAKTNSTYVFKVVKNIAQAAVIDIDFWWYEHVPKNI
jgi:hypothetical protein